MVLAGRAALARLVGQARLVVRSPRMVLAGRAALARLAGQARLVVRSPPMVLEGRAAQAMKSQKRSSPQARKAATQQRTM